MCNEVLEINNYITDSINKLCKRYEYSFRQQTKYFIDNISNICNQELKISKVPGNEGFKQW